MTLVWKRGVDSEHKAIFLKLEIAHKFIGPWEPRLHCIDRRVLENPGVRDVWRNTVSNNLEVLKGSVNSDGKSATKLQLIEKAMSLAAEKTLMTDGRRRPGQFEAASTVLDVAIDIRNQISSAYFNHPTNELQLILKKARKDVIRKVKQALTDWTEHVKSSQVTNHQ
jgi:hypothetical protein